MLPITGQFTRSVSIPGRNLGVASNDANASMAWLQKYQAWWRQRKPYNLVLPFGMRYSRILSFQRYGNHNDKNFLSVAVGSAPAVSPNFSDAAYVKAWNAFRNNVYSSAQVGLAIHERKKSMSMLTSRLLTMAEFAFHLRNRNFAKASETLGLKRGPSRKRLSAKKTLNAFGSNFLEYHFGWAPLVADIHEAINIIGDSRPLMKRVRSRSNTSSSSKSVNGPTGVPPAVAVTTTTETVTRIGYELAADVHVVDENLLLLEQLGLINPLLFVYEATPFSFVANWFFSIEEYLSSFTAFSGLQLQNCRTTCFVTTKMKQTVHHAHAYYGSTGIGYVATSEYVSVGRSTGTFDRPTLTLRSPWTLSTSRGLTAASLLAQRLR